MAQPSAIATRAFGRRLLKPNALFTSPAAHFRLKRPFILRNYNTTSKLHDYPREGVFQPNSPSRQPLNRPNTYFPPNADPIYQQQPPEYQQAPRRFRWFPITFAILISTVSMTYGYVAVTSMGLSLAPMPFNPGSPDDHEELQLLADEYDSLPIVQELRAHQWKEWVAYYGLSDPTSTSASRERREKTLSTGPLKGSQGLAAQSVFWDEEHNVMIVLVNFGEGMCGWPGVVHGGSIATVFDEVLGRLATRTLGARTTDSDGAEETGTPIKGTVAASSMVRYLEKCEPGQWYVVLAGRISDEALKDIDNKPPGKLLQVPPDAQKDVLAQPEPPSSTNFTIWDDGDLVYHNTDQCQWFIGTMMCASEVGPTLQDIMNFWDGDWEPDEVNVHLHAWSTAMHVLPKEVVLKPLPEEF